jgi:hypothetical protein
VWVSAMPYNTIKKSLVVGLKACEARSIIDDNSHLGIPLSIRIFRPKKQGEKKDNNTVDAFIEFIHPNSSNRMLKMASTTGFMVNGKKMRVYKAGTRPEKLFGKGGKKNK